MSLNLYQEAIVEAKQLRDMAEQNAKNKIIEAVTPKIKQLIEQQLVGDEEEESELIIGDEVVEPALPAPEIEDEEILDLSGLASDLESVGDELVDDSEEGANAPVSITVQNVQGDINMSLDESDEDEDLLLSKEGAQHLNSFLREYSRNKSLNSKLTLLETKVSKFKKDLSNVNLNKTKPVYRQIIATYYANLLREVNSLTDQVIFINESVDERLEKRLLITLKEIKNMSKRRDASIFRRLFEELAADEGLRELSLSEQDDEVVADEEAVDVDVDVEEVPEEVDPVAAQDALEPLASALGFEVTPIEEEELDIEVEDEEEVVVEEGDDSDEAQNEVYEIDEAAIRRELRRLKFLREQEEGRAAQGDTALAHGGEDEGDLFVDVNEDDLLNALADELGDPGVPEPTVESRRRRRNRRMAETRRRRSRPNTAHRSARLAEARAVKAEKTARHLRRQLQEMNLFNAKLLFANKLMQNRELSTKQQRTIVEALDKATNIREAKLLYKSLSSSLHKSRGSLTESRSRLLASSSRSTRSAAPSNSGADTDRWALLAGIPNKK